MEVNFVDGDAARDAIREVRDANGSDTNWMAVTYDNPKTMKLKLLGKGTGGADELSGMLTPEIAVYGLIRVVDRIDNSDTVKFATVLYLGEKIPRMLRAKISVHQNAVREFIGQAHVDYSCSTPAELTNEVIVSKVTITSGSSSRVIDSANGRPIGLGGKDSAGVTGRVTVTKKEEINTDSFAEGQEAVQEALAAVRSDVDETVWALFEFDGSKLVFCEKGTGSVDEEVVPKLRSSAMMYGLVRKIERFELTDTVKFAFITYIGADVPVMLRGRLNAYSSMIDDVFSPYHVVVHAEVPSELSDKIIVEAIAAASGTADHVLDAVPAPEPAAPVQQPQEPVHHEEKPKPKPKPEQKTPVSPRTAEPKKTGDEPRPRDALYFNDEEGCRAAIAEVRNDECPTVWAIFGTDKTTGGARLLGKGVESSEMYSLLTDKVVAWVLLRRTLKIDDSETTKFVFINWIGDNIPRMLRARLGTWSGVVQEFIQPYHVDINASSHDEITEDILMNTIAEAAGTKVHVLS